MISKNKKNSRKNSDLKRRYGITLEFWNSILEEQQGKCFICGRKLKLKGKKTSLYAHTDHNHETGEIRGILCRVCNMNIVPHFEKDIERAKNLYIYLTRENRYGKVPGKDSV